MAEQAHRIVTTEESDIHDEPHIAGSRITVRFIHERVENAGDDPQEVADRYRLDLAAVHHALAYYHGHPEAMRRLEAKRDQIIEDQRQHAITDPSELE